MASNLAENIEEEIRQRADEQIRRLHLERDAKQKEEARQMEMEIVKRVNDEKKRIAEEFRKVNEEAKILEAEATRIADDLKTVQDEQCAKLTTNEIKRRVEMQEEREEEEADRRRFENDVKLRMAEKAKEMTTGLRLPEDEVARARRIDEEVQRRAVEEARRIMEERRRTGEASEAQRIEEEIQRRAAEEARRIVAMQDNEAIRAQLMEEDVKKRAEAEAARILAGQRAQDDERRKVLEERERKLRVDEAVNKRVGEESRRIQEALRKRQEEDEHRRAAAVGKALRIEQEVQLRLGEESRKIAEHARRLVVQNPSKTPLEESSVSSQPAKYESSDVTKKTHFSSLFGLSPHAFTTPVYAPSPVQSVTATPPPKPTDRPVTRTLSEYPPRSLDNDTHFYPSAVSEPVDDAPPPFTIIEVSAPPGPLGLTLLPFTIRIPVMSETLDIYCSVVKESKTTGAIKKGDIVMSVDNFTLLADEQQSPGGQEHVDACARVLSQAPNPRRIRFYRSSSINPDSSMASLSGDEAMQIAPVIFRTGDGSKRLTEALVELRMAGSATNSAPRGPYAVEELDSPFSPARRPSDVDTTMYPVKPIDVPPALRQRTDEADTDTAGTNSGRSGRIFEHVFREKGTLGLVFAPVSLTLETSPEMFASYWALMIVGNGGVTNIRPGDLLLLCNIHSCVFNRSQARSSSEFAAAARAVVATASLPRAMRFARCTKMSLMDNPDATQWSLTAAESKLIGEAISRGGDQNRSFLNKTATVLREINEAEMEDAGARNRRENFQKRELEYLRAVDANRPQVTLSYIIGTSIPFEGGAGGGRGGGASTVQSKPKAGADESDPTKTRAQRRKELREQRSTSQDVLECRILEVVYHDKTSVGLVIEPFCVLFETLPGKMQSFWCGIVTGGTLGRVKVGDIVLYVNTHMCMIDRSQARNGREFSLALKDVIMNASVPRAIRFARCSSINVKEDPGSVYALSPTEGDKLADIIFIQGDNALFLLSKVKFVAEKTEADEVKNPEKKSERLTFERESERQYQIDLRGQMPQLETAPSPNTAGSYGGMGMRGAMSNSNSSSSASEQRMQAQMKHLQQMEVQIKQAQLMIMQMQSGNSINSTPGSTDPELQRMRNKRAEMLLLSDKIKNLQQQLNGVAGTVQSGGRGVVAQPLFVPQNVPTNALGGGMTMNLSGAGAGNNGAVGNQMGSMGRSSAPQQVSQQQPSDAIIYQIAYGTAGSMGIGFAPLTLAYELGDGQFQLVHVAVVKANNGGSSIRPGDIILTMNGLPLIGSPADTVGGDEFMQRVVQILVKQEPPKVMRFFRCSKIDINDIQSNLSPAPVALSDADAMIFLEG